MKIADLFALLRLKPDAASFTAANKLLSGVKTALIGIASLGAVIWAKNQIRQVAELGDNLDEMSQKTGVSTSSLQELAFAGSFSGLSMETLGMSLGRMSRAMDAAKKGGKEQSRAMRELGVDMSALRAGTLTTDEAFAQIADRVSKMPDGMKKTALVMQVFGRGGMQMIPMLNEGRDGLEKFRREARELGIVMDEETIKSMVQLSDQTQTLSHAWMGVKIALAREVVPTLINLVSKIQKWLKENRKIIAQRLATVFKILAQTIGVTSRAIGFLIDLVGEAHERWVGTKIILGLVAAGFVALKVASVAAAIASGVAWAIANAPLILMALLIGGAILVVQDLWVAINGGESVIGKLVSWFIDAIPRALSFALDKIGEFAQKAWEKLKDIPVIGHAIRAGESIAGGIESAVNFISGADDSPEAVNRFLKAAGKAPLPAEQIRTEQRERFFGEAAPWVRRTFERNFPELRQVTPQFNATINVNAPGGDPTQIAQQSRQQLNEFWDEKMRELDPGRDVGF